MDKLTGLRHVQQRIVKVQRRLWLAEFLMWPTVIAAGVLSAAGLVWLLRSRQPHRLSGNRQPRGVTPGGCPEHMSDAPDGPVSVS